MFNSFISVRRFIGNHLVDMFPSSWFRARNMVLKFMSIRIGNKSKVNIGFRVYGPGSVVIGDETWIGPNCHIYTTDGYGVEIGSKCDIAPEVVFISGTHEIGTDERRAGTGKAHSILIGDGTWICTRSTICSESIGKGNIIASGAVVLQNTDKSVLVAGVPAQVKKGYK